MRFRVGSWPWLLAHEVRLAWRGFFNDRVSIMLLLFVLFWIILHVPAYMLMRSFSPELLEGVGIVVAGAFFWLAFSLMLSTAVVLSVNALYDRGDLDLLMSSPLPASKVFTVRGLGVALNSVALFAGLALPFAHMGIATGNPGFVAVYPVLIGIALGAAGSAFAMTLFLARWLGARRARVIGQVLSALIGASVFMLFQSPNFVSEETLARLGPAIIEALGSGWLGPNSPLWWPVRALIGDPLAVVATVGSGAAVFLFVVGLTSRTFAAGTQESTTGPVRTTARQRKETRFGQGLPAVVVAKELRLIRRDPNLIAKTLLQALYILPLILIAARQTGQLTLQEIAPAIILLMAGIAGNLAWITISAEESPDLIGSAPVNRERVRWLKARAALTPLAVAALPFLIFYLMRAPLQALIFAVFLAVALVASAVIQVWGGKPSPQRDLKQRQKQNVALNFIEVIGTLAFAGGCYLTFIGSQWAFAVIPLGFLGPLGAWFMRRRDVV